MSTLENPEGQESEPEGPGAAPEPEAAEPEPGEVDTAEGGSTLEDPGDQDPLEAEEITVDPARVRKAPRIGRFATIGGLLGVLVAFVQTQVASQEVIDAAGGPWASNTWGFFGLMAAIFVPVGILVMCGLALLLDRRSRRGR